MAALSGVAAVLLTGASLLAALTPGCDAKGLLLPDLPSNGICCELASAAVPQSLLRLTAKDFPDAKDLCSREKTHWKFTIFTGYGSPGSGGGGGGGLSPASFGCASATEPACVQRDLSICSPACLGARTCFLRFPSDTPFIVQQEEERKTKTDTNAVIETSGSRASSGLQRGANNETVRTNVTEAQRGRLNISSTENKMSRFRGLDINSKSLPAIGQSLLRSDLTLRRNHTNRLHQSPIAIHQSPFSVYTSGSGTASEAGKGFCCRLTGGEAPQPLPGVTSPIDCQRQCRNKRLGLAVRINSQQCGCSGDSFNAGCNKLNTCDGCLADNSCMTVYRISYVVTVGIARTKIDDSKFGVVREDRDGRTDTIRQQLGESTLNGFRSLRNLTVVDVSGNKQTRQVLQENRRMTAEVGSGNNIQGGVAVEATITVTGSARTNRNTSQQTSDRDRRVLTTNLTRPGTQEGIRRQSVDRDVTENRDATVQTAETSKEVNKTASASGNQRAELLPGLRSPRDGSASLSAGDRNISQLSQESIIKSTVERTNDNINLQTAGGDKRRIVASSATVRTDAERTGARNDSNTQTTGFATDDPLLGKVGLTRREENVGSVQDRATASGARTAGSSRAVTTCARCNSTTDRTDRSRSDRQNQTTAHIETVKRDITKATSVSPGSPLPALYVEARDIREAQTADSISRAAGTTHNVTTMDTRRAGFRSRRNRNVRTVERNNGTDHVEEVKKTTVLTAVTL